MSTTGETRAANASLLGYHYQLDKALLEILSCDAADARVTVEGIKDVDVASNTVYHAIQCKYYEAQKGIPSALREPIQMMLLEFAKDPGKQWAFTLYVHFGKPSNLAISDISTLKSILTYSKAKVTHRFHEDNNLSDEKLVTFLGRFKFVVGPSHTEQQKHLFKIIQRRFNATPAEAESFLYPKALSITLRVATRKSREERTVLPKDVLEEIRHAATSIISPWLLRMLGAEKAFNFIRRSIRDASLFRTTEARTIVMGVDDCEQTGLVQISLADFLEKLAINSFRVGKTLCDAKPWNVLIVATPEDLIGVKRLLLAKNIYFNDGYEHIEFSPEAFAEDPVVNSQTVRGKATGKLGRTSYFIRLATFAAAAPYLGVLSLGDVLLCTADQDVQLKVNFVSGTSINIGSNWSRSQILNLVTR